MLQDLGEWESKIKVVLSDNLLQQIARIIIPFGCYLDRRYDICLRDDVLVVEGESRYSSISTRWLQDAIEKVAIKKAREQGQQEEHKVVLDVGDINLTGLSAVLLETKKEREGLELQELEELIEIRERELGELKERYEILKAKQQAENPRLPI
jgi:hypothetical protein